ncbi:hypothetical protein KFK09_021629 [Dendrobium nobile]|uniref:Uncharacterized protein n=1 Tax=Dendrobium nobile TaxID=94219 RepID=A0A8T3AQM8_DENNO|nr:hypothetical protein KFK09_021629 [Dendrobium nobile]
MQAHGLEGGLRASAAVSPLVCLLDTQETSHVLAFLVFCLSLSVVFLGHREREMEEKKLSFVDEFFPEKEPALPSKSDILSTIFPPRSPVAVKDSVHYEVSAVRATKQENEGQSLTEQMGASSGSFQVSSGKNQEQDGLKKNNDPNVPCEIAEPCLMSSSVYYGGRDDFIPEISSSYKSDSSNNYKKDNEDGNNSDVANRGEWWQGSFYY